MLNSLSSFLFHTHREPTPNVSEDPSYQMQELDGDWLLVDRLQEEDPLEVSCDSDGLSSGPPSPIECYNRTPCTTMSLYIPITQREPLATPPSSPSPQQMDGSWYVTPPPCFTAGSPLYLETSPLENLLIEHPSMSVYGPISNYSLLGGLISHYESKEGSPTPAEVRLKRGEGVKMLVVATVASEDEEAVRRLQANVRENRKNRNAHRSMATANADAVMLEERHLLLRAQRKQQGRDQRKLKASYLERQNRAKLYQANKKRNQALMQPIKCNSKRC